MSRLPPTGELPAVVIGMGNTFRHDDGVGPTVAHALAGRVEGADVVELDGECTRLLDAWTDRALAVVVDAVCAGGEPGAITRLEVGLRAGVHLGAETLSGCSPLGSTHGAGLAEAIALGHVLGRLPRHLVVFGVEPADLTAGPGLSPPVRSSAAELVELVLAELDHHGVGV